MLNRLIFPFVLMFLLVCLYYFSSITTPFIAAGILAYVFQPLVGYLEQKYVPRWVGSLIVVCLLLTIVSVFFIYTAPILYKQLTKLISHHIPAYLRQLQGLVKDLLETLNHRVPPEYAAQIQQGIQTLSKDSVTWLLANTQSAFQGGLAVLHYITIILMVPVLSFYLMKDWMALLDAVTYYIPPQNKKMILQQSKKIDKTLASFARGQALVCLVLSIYYSVALHIIGVDFGALIGSLTGLFAFIPYLGAIVGFSVSAAISLLQVGGGIGLFSAVAVIFAVGQALEGVVLSPNIVGRSIRLHPLWVMFALFLGGYLFGFAGVLVATPVAGALGVIVRHALNEYRQKMYALYYGASRRRSNGSKA